MECCAPRLGEQLGSLVSSFCSFSFFVVWFGLHLFLLLLPLPLVRTKSLPTIHTEAKHSNNGRTTFESLGFERLPYQVNTKLFFGMDYNFSTFQSCV